MPTLADVRDSAARNAAARGFAPPSEAFLLLLVETFDWAPAYADYLLAERVTDAGAREADLDYAHWYLLFIARPHFPGATDDEINWLAVNGKHAPDRIEAYRLALIWLRLKQFGLHQEMHAASAAITNGASGHDIARWRALINGFDQQTPPPGH